MRERRLGGGTTRRCAVWRRMFTMYSTKREEDVRGKSQVPHPVPSGRTDQTVKSQRESFTIAPMAWQVPSGQKES